MNKIKNWRLRTKQRLVDAFGSNCGICGYNKCISALEFHHLNEKEKEFGLSCVTKSWDKIVKEARKCIMICSNCHSEIHSGLIEIPENIKRFDECFSTYNKNEGNQGIYYNLYNKCVCGNIKPVIRKYCSIPCRAKSQYKNDWDDINLQQLYDKYGSYTAVGKILNVSYNTIKKRLGH